ncbi:MAG: hypothetical protein M3P83_06280 [Actinomycetota bacterium]|nr:hypothetical protein [Actinomycetota bacterium]
MNAVNDEPQLGAVFWPVGHGDSTTVVVSDELVLQVDLHDMAKADDDANPEIPVVDRLVEALPVVDGKPYLAVFALTHVDEDHCLGFADLLEQVTIGELWATPRLWREYAESNGDGLCEDAKAFQEEAERRVAVVKSAIEAGEPVPSGDRIIVIGHDRDRQHAYEELPVEYKSGPGQAIAKLDGQDCSDKFEAFIHAPFKDDCAAARNETSLAMQVTLTDPGGQTGKVLLFGDLGHDTIMKIFNYSEYYAREQYLAWDLLLAPHHCSKKVMYLPDEDGHDVFHRDVMDAFGRHANPEPVVVSSSALIPAADVTGANPPHRKAANRYQAIADEFICTMSWPNAAAPVPVVFVVDALGARILSDETVDLTASETLTKSAQAAPIGRRLAAVTTAAAAVAAAASRDAVAAPATSGPQRLREGIAADRGGDKAPQTAVGFGR